MKQLLALTFALSCALLAQGTIILEDNFDTYTDGALAGQGGWTTIAGDATDLLVSGGSLVFAGTGGDAVIQSPNFSQINQSDVYFAFDLTVTTVSTAGARPTIATIGGDRAAINIRDWNSSTEFDLVNNAGGQLALSTTYRVIAHYLAGVSETFWASTAPEEAIPYYTKSTGGGGRSYIQFKIPDAAVLSATVDNVIVATTWNEAAGVDEPAPIPTPTAIAGVAADKLNVTFDRVADGTLLYEVSGSNDLSTWSSIWTSTGGDNTDGPVTVEDSVTLSTEPTRFLKLDVTRP